MTGLPVSLIIGIWLVAAMWIVGLTAYCFNFPSELVWFMLFMGTGVALIEWRARTQKKDS
jgi:hypothetical protein